MCRLALEIVIAATLAFAGSALAVDGQTLITQDKAEAGNVTPGDAAGFPVVISRAGAISWRAIWSCPPARSVFKSSAPT